MGVMLTWLEKTLEVNPHHMAPLEGVSADRGLQSDKNTDSAGTTTKNLRGYEPRKFSCQYKAVTRAGTPDIVGDFASWEALVGMYAPIYINGKRFGGKKYILNSVNISDVIVSPSGAWLSGVIKLDFEEYENEKSGDKGSVTSTTLSNAMGISRTANKINSAAQIRASAYDKATKKG